MPNFTGRQKECDEIIGHVTSASTRLVSVWGSPGFGKTSVAIAVGHDLQAQGLSVYFLSLRGLKSKGDLTSKFLGLLRRSTTLKDEQQTLAQSLAADDELCSKFGEMSEHCVFILDNADDLLESGVPNVKEEVINLLEEILNRSDKVTFLLTTRESLRFLDFRLQGHQAVRIRELDESSSQRLVQRLLPEASVSDCLKVMDICGNVPLAIKLLCSSVTEDGSQSGPFYDEFMKTAIDNIVKKLDNPDYPSNLRMKSLFDGSFQRLTIQDKEALVSLCILPEQFDVEIAATVLGITRSEASKVLQRLHRKSLIDFSSNSEKFTFHKLLHSFASEKGELEMKETVLDSKTRFYEFYIALFEKLNGNFLTGFSMQSFIQFFEDEQSIVQSLIDGCFYPRTVDRILEVLVKAELFLYFLYFWRRALPDKIYDSAITAATRHGRDHFNKALLGSKAFGEVIHAVPGGTLKRLCELEESLVPTSVHDDKQKGKLLFYGAIYQLVMDNVEEGAKSLEQAVSSLDASPEHTVLKLIAFQILSLYCDFKNNSVQSSDLYIKALQECHVVGDKGLLVIPKVKGTIKEGDKNKAHLRKCQITQNQPLQLEIIFLVSQAVMNFATTETYQCFGLLLSRILQHSKTAFPSGTTGSFHYHFTGICFLRTLCDQQGDEISIQEILGLPVRSAEHNGTEQNEQNSAAEERNEHFQRNYSEALESNKRALEIALKLFGEEHSETADSYHLLGITQHSLKDYDSAAESASRALAIRLTLFGEEHPKTANSYHELGITQHSLEDYDSAAESASRALAIRRKLFGEEHPNTADSYHELGAAQHSLEEFTSAVESKTRALAIRLKLFGEDHPMTADSYHDLGITQHSLEDYTSAAESKTRALAIRVKLFGEDHPKTAGSYHDLGITQHSLEDYTSAVESESRALAIRLKLFGEEHSETALSYHLLGITQHSLEDYTSAVESVSRAFAIRLKLFGEEHPMTADSYHDLGITQHSLEDYASAVQSKNRALAIRIKLFGEEHPMTADSYHELGITQHSLEDYNSAAESASRALAIRLTLFGEEHSATADSYHLLGITQHSLEDYTSAVESKNRALAIRLKLFGEEHSTTADSYHSLGITQHSLEDLQLAKSKVCLVL